MNVFASSGTYIRTIKKRYKYVQASLQMSPAQFPARPHGFFSMPTPAHASRTPVALSPSSPRPIPSPSLPRSLPLPDPLASRRVPATPSRLTPEFSALARIRRRLRPLGPLARQLTRRTITQHCHPTPAYSALSAPRSNHAMSDPTPAPDAPGRAT